MSFRISLNKATKSQLGSKARAEEEEKAREEEEARKKVLAEFLDEHGDDEESAAIAESSRQAGDRDPNVFVPQGTKRHFTGRARSTKSGPGTLAPEPLDAFPRPGPQARFGNQFGPRFGAPEPPVQPFHEANKSDENVYTTVVAKVSNLPPDTEESTVKELFADYKTLKAVKMEKIPPSGPLKTRPFLAMKVTFDQDANPRELDDAMNKMNEKKYLGCGYYLHLDRYLGGRLANKEKDSLPFGAKWVTPDISREFAPTVELGGERGRRDDRESERKLVITAYPPPDLPTLRLIHMTVEGVIQGGIEFEAALMEKTETRNDEKYAWLYDRRHPLSRYYQWRTWQLCTGNLDATRAEIFEGMGEWQGLAAFPNEFVTELKQLPPNCYSLEREEDEEDGARRPRRCASPYPGMVDTGYGMMTVASRAFFMFLLFSMAPAPALNSEIAPISTFAIENADKGMDEIVSLLISNIFDPFCLSAKANPRYRPTLDKNGQDTKRRRNLPTATMNGIRALSDVCVTSHKAGGKAWKYRELIGTKLRERGVFTYLERLPRTLDLGRGAENEFREGVNYALDYWKEEYLFSPETLEEFDEAFNWRKRQKDKENQERKLAEKRAKAQKPQSQVWKFTGFLDGAADANMAKDKIDSDDDSAGEQMDIGGTGVPQQEVVLQAQSSTEELQEYAEVQTPTAPAPGQSVLDDGVPGETAAARAKRMRPKAEDMFASDEE
jgi:U2-associated protein SR140